MSKSEKTEYVDNPDKDYKLVIASDVKDNDDEETILATAETIQKQSESWMYDALQSFEQGGRQYSVRFNEASSSLNSDTTLDTIKELALNAQSDISKIQKINNLVRQAENEAFPSAKFFWCRNCVRLLKMNQFLQNETVRWKRFQKK